MSKLNLKSSAELGRMSLNEVYNYVLTTLPKLNMLTQEKLKTKQDFDPVFLLGASEFYLSGLLCLAGTFNEKMLVKWPKSFDCLYPIKNTWFAVPKQIPSRYEYRVYVEFLNGANLMLKTLAETKNGQFVNDVISQSVKEALRALKTYKLKYLVTKNQTAYVFTLAH